jgi:D-mannonate dehydratase
MAQISGIMRVLHLTKNRGEELKSKFIWETNPINNIRSILDMELGSEPTKDSIELWMKKLVLVCNQNIDVLEYAFKKSNIDWRKLQLEFYSKQGWIEGEYDWRE